MITAGLTLLALGAVGGCSDPVSSPPALPTRTPTPAPATGSSPTATPSASLEPVEPTTTNTLAPPPAPTSPAPSTAGRLGAATLPVPTGWRTVARAGGDEEGYQGNGTWVHARDPRYAAQDVITLGCADVTRDDYPDPVAALEGTYVNGEGEPGIGLALEFADAEAAGRYWSRYGEQVRACTRLDDPVHTELVASSVVGPDSLIDRRTYPDSRWTEVARRVGTRVTLIILTDRGHSITPARARRLLAAMP